MVSVKVGNLTLLDSGTVIAPKGAPIHFVIKDLEYIFSFVNEGEEKPKIRTISNTGKRLEIELINFNDVVGVGNINPMSMGTIDGQELLLMFRVSMLKEGGKTMQYSWYLKGVTNSNTQNNG